MKTKAVAIEARRIEAISLFSYEIGKHIIAERDGDDEPVWRRIAAITITDINPFRAILSFEDGTKQVVGATGTPVMWKERNGEGAR